MDLTIETEWPALEVQGKTGSCGGLAETGWHLNHHAADGAPSFLAVPILKSQATSEFKKSYSNQANLPRAIGLLN